MRIVLQRVQRASVTVENELINTIGPGYLLLIGFNDEDSASTVRRLANKVLGLRLWDDKSNTRALPLDKERQQILAISQFTLYASVKKGKRPSFTAALQSDAANKLYVYFCAYCREQGYDVKPGVFGAHMFIDSVNDGPVTLILDSKDL